MIYSPPIQQSDWSEFTTMVQDCLMTQRYDLCPENASGKLLFMHGSAAQMNMCTLYAYGQT